jgi:hypothetical protein
MLKTTLRQTEPGRTTEVTVSVAQNSGTVVHHDMHRSRSVVNWTTFTPTPSPKASKENQPINRQTYALSSPTPVLGERHRNQRGLWNTSNDIVAGGQKKAVDTDDRLKSKKLRHRPSFLITPFRKKLGDNPKPTLAQNTNSSQPPRIFSPTTGSRQVSQSSSKKSETLKDKLRRYFRKTSAESASTHVTVAALPPQHIEARRIHFGNFLSVPNSQPTLGEGHPSASEHKDITPASSPPAYDAFSSFDYSNNIHRANSPEASEATMQTKSRVTSWADSTVTGSVAQENQLSVIAEDEAAAGDISALPPVPTDKRSSSLGSSFLRQFMRSRATINTQDDSNSTAAPIITKTQHTVHQAIYQNPASTAENTPNAHDTLPSQRRRSSLLSLAANWRNRATVRSITPDCQPVPENLRDSASPPPIPERQDTGSYRRRLQKKLPSISCQTYQLSPSQLAARAQRAENRWQGQLEEQKSLFFPYSPSISPGRTRSLRKTLSHDSPTLSTSKQAAEHSSRLVISPSVYSRATDGETPRGIERVASAGSVLSEETGTAFIMTGREPVVAKAFPLQGSPKKKEDTLEPIPHMREDSVEWQTFLSAELADISAGQFSVDGDYLTSTPMRTSSAPKSRGHVREMQQIVDDSEDLSFTALLRPGHAGLPRPASATKSSPLARSNISQENIKPLNVTRTVTSSSSPLTQSKRPRKQENVPPRRSSVKPGGDPSTSSLASFMNDRFPMFDTGGPSSRPGSTTSLRAIMAGKTGSDGKGQLAKTETKRSTTSTIPKKSSPLASRTANVSGTSESGAQDASKRTSKATHLFAPPGPSSSKDTASTPSTAKPPPSPSVSFPTNTTPLSSTPHPATTPPPLQPPKTPGTDPNILSPIPRRRQSTLVATLTSASLATSYHTARQDGSPSTPRATRSSPALHQGLSQAMADDDDDNDEGDHSATCITVLGLGNSPFASLHAGTVGGTVGGGASTASTPSSSGNAGIRRSGARRGAARTLRDERGKGVVGMPNGSNSSTGANAGGSSSLASLASDLTLMEVLRRPMYREGVLRANTASRESLRSYNQVRGLQGSGSGLGARRATVWGPSGGSDAKENRGIGGAGRGASLHGEDSPGKRLAQRWLSGRRAGGTKGNEDGGSSPVFL